MQLNQKKIHPLFFPVFIFLLASFQYANTLQHDYAWDDKLVITGNQYTIRGIDGLYDIFTKRVSVPNKNVYRPVPQALFAIEYDLFHQNPHAGHFFSVLWYALLCVIVFYFIRFLFPAVHPLFPLLAAILFTIHPLHVEVVANIKSRDETLAALFGLSAIMLLAKGVQQKKWWPALAGLACFALAFLSKENVITLLPVVLLVLWYKAKQFRMNWKIIAGTLGLLAVCGIIISWINYQVTNPSPGKIIQLDATVLNNVFLWTTEPGKVVPTALANIGRYLLLFVFPHPLVHMYGYNQIPLNGWLSLRTLAVLLVLAYAAYYTVTLFNKKNPAVFGILFFAATYSIYSNLFVLAPDTMADRYLFLPSVGLVLIATYAIFQIPALPVVRSGFGTMANRIILAFFVIIAAGFFIRTFLANRDWQDDFTLIYNRIKYMENNAAAQATFGLMLSRESEMTTNPEQKKAKEGQAMQAFIRSLEIYPDFYWSWISVGKIFTQRGLYDKAELAFLKAQQLEPLTPDGYYCLGALYYTMGESELATIYLEKAILLEPDAEETYEMLGKTYLQANNSENLRALAEAGLKKFPANAEFDALLGTYYFRTGNLKEAGQFTKRALQKNPQNMTARILQSSLPHE